MPSTQCRLRVHTKLLRTLGTLDLNGALSHRHSHLLPALCTLHQAVVNQLQKSLPVEANNDIFPNQKSGHPADIAFLELLGCLWIFADIPLNKIDFVLRKKLFRLGAVRSGLRRKNRDIFHRTYPPALKLGQFLSHNSFMTQEYYTQKRSCTPVRPVPTPQAL